MVGVALGMLTVIIIAQVLAQSEARRRNVAMGGDADINGSLSLMTIQRDIQMAGFGMALNSKALGCPIVNILNGEPQTNLPLVPVMIANGINGLSDSITVMRGNTLSTAVPAKVLASNDFRYTVDSTLGFRTNDQFITIPEYPGPTQTCQLFTATSSNASLDTQITESNLPHANSNPWNVAQATTMPFYLVNVGTLIRHTYTVTADAPYALRVFNRAPANGQESAEDIYTEIVNLQALYGKDTNLDGTIDVYNTTSPTTADGWKQVVSVRLALVARSNHAEKSIVTDEHNAPQWDIGTTSAIEDETLVDCGTSKCIDLKIDHVPDWKYYRFKVFSTTIPLRNVLWNN